MTLYAKATAIGVTTGLLAAVIVGSVVLGFGA